MGTKPRVSIIIPAYNAERFLNRCLNSVTRQTFSDFEAIIVDDGSTDRTWDICTSFANADNRFHIYKKENGGVSTARNFALDKVKGEWICFLDADDELFPEALQDINYRVTEDIDCIIAGYQIFDENGSATYSIQERIEKRIDRDAAVRLMYRPEYYQYLGYIAGKFYRASSIHDWQIRFNQAIYYNEDRLFTTQYLCHCSTILFITKPVYKINEHPGSAMHTANSSFTAKFFTDMDGFVEMRKSIEAAKGSGENIQLAKEGIFSSYQRIKIMINSHPDHNVGSALLLEKKLIQSISLTEYLSFRWRVLLDKLHL